MPNATRQKSIASKKKRKQQKKQARRKLILLLDMGLVVLFLFSLTMLTVEIVQYIRARQTYKTVREAVTVTDSEAQDTTETEDTAENAEEQAAETAEDTDTVPEPTAEPRKLSAEPGISVDWEALQKENSEIRAWLYCPGTTLNYPVVYTDNNDYYINHDFYGNEDECGALFFDYCTDFSDEGPANWIIYGHRRNDKSMFGILSRFGNEEFLKRFPVMYLLTPEHSYRVELFACRTIHADSKYFPTWFAGEEELNAYVNKALEQSYWVTDMKVQPTDTILTMVTCNKYDVTDDPRLLLHGRLVELD